jgi:hypothetical protein
MKQTPNPGPQTSDHQRCQLEFRLPGVAVARTATDGYGRLFPHPANPIRTLMNTFSRCLTPFHTVKKSLAPPRDHALCVLTVTRVPLDVECSMFGFHSDFTPISTQSDPIRPTDTIFFCHPCAIRNPASNNPTCRPKVQPSPTQSNPVQHAFFTPSRPTPYDRVEQLKSL